MIGKTISHYRILEELGRGGMGIVYKALDTTLDRFVAIKFLPPHLINEEEARKRFIHEAKAASALNHSNIGVIHEIDRSEDGQTFIVMALYEGDTLRERIDRGDIGFDEALDITSQIAAGLARAHEKEIVHRDIKPSNILITRDGEAKIIDFGLAKLTGKTKLTKEGTTLGTIAYMSPEQIQGQDLDHRSDIFSFGAVLYEMLTGRTPFHGDHEAAMMYSIVNEEPQPLSSSTPGIPSQLENFIERALEKDPADRYQSMQDLLSDLKRLKRKTTEKMTVASEQKQYSGTHTIARSPISYIAVAIAVVIAAVASYFFFFPKDGDDPLMNSDRVFITAFENRTGDSALDPIGRLAADWVTQGILQNELTEAIPTTTMLMLMQDAGLKEAGLEDRDKLIELASATHSGILVAGMFYRVGEDIQIEAQIIDAQRNDVMLTLDPVRGPLSEPMKAIDALRQKVLGALAIHVSQRGSISVFGEPPVYEAYVEYLEGDKYFGKDYEKAFEHYRRSLEIDPHFGAPKLKIAVGYANMRQYETADSIFQTIDRHSRRVSPFQRYYLDWFEYSLQGKNEEVLATLLHIESVAPMHVTTNYLIGLYAVYLNRPRKTVETFAKIDFNVRWADYASRSWRFGVLCDAHHLLEDHEKELEVAREAQKYYPKDLGRRADEARALAALRRIEELHDVIEKSKRIEQSRGNVTYVMTVAALELRAHGNRIEGLKIAEQVVQWCEEHDAENTEARADALYRAERWDEAYTLYRELVEEDPDNWFHKAYLGTTVARLGDTEEALRLADELANMEAKYLFGADTYNRACIHAILGEREEAVRLLQESLNQGWKYIEHMHRDIDLESLHDYPSFQELLRPKG
jgi:serine/threonine protein kinase